MYDKKIILGHCENVNFRCSRCAFYRLCDTELTLENAAEKIKRQKEYIKGQSLEIDFFRKSLKTAKAEAVKEFAEKVSPIIEELVDIAFSYERSRCVIDYCKKPSEIACGSDVCIRENKIHWQSMLLKIMKEMIGDAD